MADALIRERGADNERRAWREAFAAYTGPIAYEVRDLIVTTQGDQAFVHSLNHVSGTLAGGHVSDLWVRWTACFRRIEGVTSRISGRRCSALSRTAASPSITIAPRISCAWSRSAAKIGSSPAASRARAAPPCSIRSSSAAPRTRQPNVRKALVKRRLEELIEEAIIDAYGESEQRVGFLTMLEEHLAVPFTTDILGVPVRVERVDLNDTEEIVAICRRGRQRQLIHILNLRLPSPPPVGWEWIEAYRHWVRGGR